MKYLRIFENEAAYEAYKESEDWITPNVSLCTGENTVKYEPYIPLETRLIAIYNVTGTTSATRLQSGLTSNIASMEIDDVELDTPVSAYTFHTVGEHIVKYTLTDNTIIGRKAFSGCGTLSSIMIPDSVTSIGNNAFSACNYLSSITIPDSVTSIGEEVFTYCGFSSITIPDSITSIGAAAFQNCTSLSSVTIGSGVTSIGENLFGGCTSLSSITVSTGNTAYDSRNNCNAIIETATNTLIQGCGNTIIPDSVTSIGVMVFYSCGSLSSITIPDSVTSIGLYAFEYCSNLSAVTIPDSVTSIGNRAFGGCSNLSSVTIGSSVTSIGEYAFQNCTSLSKIIYNGTQAQWTTVGRVYNWCYAVPATVVHCTDGDVAL